MNDTAASFILVQVRGQVEKNEEHSLNHQPIRLCMSPCAEPTDERPARCVLLSSAPRTTRLEGVEGGFDVSLCIRGMFAPSRAENPSGWSFLSAELTKQLQVIANSNWQDAKTRSGISTTGRAMPQIKNLYRRCFRGPLRWKLQ